MTGESDTRDRDDLEKLLKSCDLDVRIAQKDAAGRRRYLIFNRTHNSFTVFQQRFQQFLHNPVGHDREESALIVTISIVVGGLVLATWWALR